MIKHQFITLFFATLLSCSSEENIIKIMPVGDSITAGEHYGFPAVNERTGYRKALYEMLIDSGYKVDFVGSQNHGIRSETDSNWFDWNNEAYPGWKIPEIANRLKIALHEHKPGILLIHVGTNGEDWENKPSQVMGMLNMINDFSIENNHSITVFLCLIVNRFVDEDPEPTSKFNAEVAEKVKKRNNDKIKIILVDMENGAGIEYSDRLPNLNANPPFEGGDMLGRNYSGVAYDKYHPNDKGNVKMATKFYYELVKVLNQ